ncbi:hypothetical protein ACFSSC_10805 [Corynebacterium mendelii]|uniref:Rv3212 family protein n=1 Tax=Corynebacterium mendelii TaxID=2765362 RepID=UPI003625D37F
MNKPPTRVVAAVLLPLAAAVAWRGLPTASHGRQQPHDGDPAPAPGGGDTPQDGPPETPSRQHPDTAGTTTNGDLPGDSDTAAVPADEAADPAAESAGPAQPRVRGPLRRKRRDLVAAGVIAAVCCALVTTVWVGAPVRHSHLTTFSTPFDPVSAIDRAPDNLAEAWRRPSPAVPELALPLVDKNSGLVFAGTDATVTALDPTDGHEVWSYTRDSTLCSMSVASWGSVIAAYAFPGGCGDVTAINADTGTYRATRSDIASLSGAPVMSNSAAGTVGPDRLELWRSDLVRTIEYGDKTAKQEPNMQPTENCTIDSALTRTETVAIVEVCPANHTETDGDEGTKATGEPIIVDGQQWWLRFVGRVPEDSRKPEFSASVPLDAPAHLVAVGQGLAAVELLTGRDSAEIASFDDAGTQISRQPVPRMPADPPGSGAVFTPVTSDLAHAMSFFDGARLILFSPDTLEIMAVFDQATGTPVDIDGQLFIPTNQGYDVTDGYSTVITRSIAVDRDSYTGVVGVAVAGPAIVEKRGRTLVGLRDADEVAKEQAATGQATTTPAGS